MTGAPDPGTADAAPHRSPPERSQQERGQPRALPAPLQGADPGRGEEDGRRAAPRRHGARAATCACRARTFPSRRSASVAAAIANSCCRATASTSPATASRGPRAAGRRRRQRAGGEGDSEDDFVFSLSREEFMQIFFDDLELPNLARTDLGRAERHKSVRAGYTKSGVPANLAVIRTLTQSLARRIALGGGLAREAQALEAAFARGRGGGRGRRRPRAAARRARAAAPAARGAAVSRRRRPALPQPGPAAGADRARGDVLPDGRVGVDGRGQEGPRQALLHAAVPLPHPQVRRGGPGLHPPHRRRRGSRRGHVLPRPALRRHGRLFGAGARRPDPRRALRQRLERLRGAGLRRRRVRRRSRPQRALPARAAAARDALLHLPRARRRRTRSEHTSRCGPSTSRWSRPRATSPCAAPAPAKRSIRCSASCSARKRHEQRRGRQRGGRPRARRRAAPRRALRPPGGRAAAASVGAHQ